MAAIAQLKASPMPAMRAGGFWVQANLVADSDPPAAIDLYQQAIDLNSGGGANSGGDVSLDAARTDREETRPRSTRTAGKLTPNSMVVIITE